MSMSEICHLPKNYNLLEVNHGWKTAVIIVIIMRRIIIIITPPTTTLIII